ncbi:MAG TPA: SRPBCC domain-containing protein [Caulobacteraceae bacterium]
MTKDAEEVVVEADLQSAPEKVWRALSEPELVARWLLPGDIRPEPGARFAFDDDGRRIECEVLEALPQRCLRYRWREAGAAVESEVSFVLTPLADGGTHLRVAHRPFVVSLADERARRAARRTISRSAFDLRMAA